MHDRSPYPCRRGPFYEIEALRPRAQRLPGLTLWGLIFNIYPFIFCGRHQKHKVATNGPYSWSPGLIFGAACTIFRAGARPRAPGPAVVPQGTEIGQKPGA